MLLPQARAGSGESRALALARRESEIGGPPAFASLLLPLAFFFFFQLRGISTLPNWPSLFRTRPPASPGGALALPTPIASPATRMVPSQIGERGYRAFQKVSAGVQKAEDGILFSLFIFPLVLLFPPLLFFRSLSRLVGVFFSR